MGKSFIFMVELLLSQSKKPGVYRALQAASLNRLRVFNVVTKDNNVIKNIHQHRVGFFNIT
jgi:hypothetical protein